MKLKFLLGGFLLLALSACVTPAKQTQALLAGRPPIPAKAEVAKVPFINQTAGYCGPATLTMALQWAGKNVDVNEIAPQVYTPKSKGSLQTDLISSARRNGMMAIPISGLSSLLQEISAGHPVIVFENLALTWLPQWHYAVVFGYDLDAQTVTMHSGPEAFKHWDMSKFERSWMLGEYWGLVVLPPGELSATANELAQVSAASALEQIGKLDEAEKSYLAIIQKWPDSLSALMGLGNIYFAKSNFEYSVEYLRRATKAHPDVAMAWHNQAIAEHRARNAQMKKAAHSSAARALALASSEEISTYKKDLENF